MKKRPIFKKKKSQKLFAEAGVSLWLAMLVHSRWN